MKVCTSTVYEFGSSGTSPTDGGDTSRNDGLLHILDNTRGYEGGVGESFQEVNVITVLGIRGDTNLTSTSVEGTGGTRGLVLYSTQSGVLGTSNRGTTVRNQEYTLYGTGVVGDDVLTESTTELVRYTSVTVKTVIVSTLDSVGGNPGTDVNFVEEQEVTGLGSGRWHGNERNGSHRLSQSNVGYSVTVGSTDVLTTGNSEEGVGDSSSLTGSRGGLICPPGLSIRSSRPVVLQPPVTVVTGPSYQQGCSSP